MIQSLEFPLNSITLYVQRVIFPIPSRIFDIAPGAQEIFAKFRDVPKDQLASNSEVHKHASNVMETIGSAVDGLDDLEALAPVLHDLGAKHVKWEVQEEHFDVHAHFLCVSSSTVLFPFFV